MRSVGEGGVYKPGSECAPEAGHAGTLILDVQLQSWEKIHFSCLSSPSLRRLVTVAPPVSKYS